MMPVYGMPVSDQLNATIWQPGAVTVLQRLRVAFHPDQIFPSIAYDKGQPRLLISVDVIVWTDAAGEVLYWGPTHTGEPAGTAPVEELEDVARRIVEQLIERETAMTTH
ncbi:hypothetical protein AB0M44_10530 [Streptosporangium subroseum]|uniref:hypothetical protein n=1 Tax=Streptosporangium subroseum TaxID=106412 RepID=UPI0034306859